jgi:hypothetical protein
MEACHVETTDAGRPDAAVGDHGGSDRLMPHGTAAETATPQQVYFRLHNDDALIAKPGPIIGGRGLQLISPSCRSC